MATVRVPVLKPLTYQGRAYVRGDLVTLRALEAARLAMQGFVTLTVGATVAREVVAPVPETPTPRRQYRRRDLTAEPAE